MLTILAISANNVNFLLKLCHDVFTACTAWFADNRLALNINKTNYIIIGNINKNQCVSLPFNGGTVNKVNCVKFLGVLLDDKLSWENHIAYVTEKCCKGLGMIRRARIFLPTKCLIS